MGLACVACSDSSSGTYLVKSTAQEKICKLWEKPKFLFKASLKSFNSFPVTCPTHCRFLKHTNKEAIA